MKEKHELAYADYQSGMKYKDIAEKYGVSIGTVNSWKSRYEWTREPMHKKSENLCIENKEPMHKKKQPKISRNDDTEVVDSVMENDELNDKQRLFCLHYIKRFNATKAYQRAYGCSYETAMVNGCELLRNTKVKAEIDRLKQARFNKEMLKPEDVFQKYMDIAFADITDYVEFGREEVPVMGAFGPIVIKNEETGEKQNLTKIVNTVRFKESMAVDGTIISEVRQGRDGASIKLPDRTKALNWLSEHMDMATEEQRVRIEAIKVKANLNEPREPINTYNGLPSRVIGRDFIDVNRDIDNRKYRFFDFEGGRGSLKSSFCGLKMVDLIMLNPNMCGLAMRQVKDTIKDSVYAQIVWAIDELGLTDRFHCTKSPMEITKKDTGQVVYFRGGDDPTKIKSIKPPKGMYIGVAWFEEKDQFKGKEAIRNINQSVMRGGDDYVIMGSYNVPRSQRHFINIDKREDKKNRLIHRSCYLNAPKEWLGKPFFEEAEDLEQKNELSYRHEYLGEAVGTGLSIFDNIVEREITDKEMESFDRWYFGNDWGWYPDPNHFSGMHYSASERKLYICYEVRCYKTKNIDYAEMLKDFINVRITADIGEGGNKSIADFQSYGFNMRGAIKGPGSVDAGMKWLQSLNSIVIDPVRCPETAREFANYEYEQTKDGEAISGYPDRDNHSIDSVRYAMEGVWRRRGQ